MISLPETQLLRALGQKLHFNTLSCTLTRHVDEASDSLRYTRA